MRGNYEDSGVAEGAVGGKPCRACSDFKNLIKFGPSQSNSSSTTPASSVSTSSTSQSSSKKATTETGDKRGPGTDLAVQDHKDGVCPPDRLELGSATWTFLHSVAAYFPQKPTVQDQDDARQLVSIVSRLFPCKECADDLKVDLKLEPPVVTNTLEFSKWMCRLHNRVNRKLGKPEFDCSRVLERWRDGWKDGSCD